MAIVNSSFKILHWALGLSVAIHALVLSIKFASPLVERWSPPNAMIMAVLVNASSQAAPKKASVIAQTQLNGGGNLDEKGWTPSSPLERSTTAISLEKRQTDGVDEKSVAKLENEIAQLMAQAKNSDWKASEVPKSASKREAMDIDKMAIDLAARIDKQAQAYASRPKKVFIGLQASQSDLAVWIEAWQRKIEGVGNAFYPEQAQGKIRGALILTAGVRKDGRVESIKIDRSSGHKLLDDSAVKIMEMSGPFEPFEPGVSKRIDVLYITRQWKFGPSGFERLEEGVIGNAEGNDE